MQLLDCFDYPVFSVSFGSNEDFLEAFGGLGDCLEAARLFSLDLNGSGATGFTERFSTIGASYDDADDSLYRFDLFHGLVAFFGCALMSSARWHRSVNVENDILRRERNGAGGLGRPRKLIRRVEAVGLGLFIFALIL